MQISPGDSKRLFCLRQACLLSFVTSTMDDERGTKDDGSANLEAMLEFSRRVVNMLDATVDSLYPEEALFRPFTTSDPRLCIN